MRLEEEAAERERMMQAQMQAEREAAEEQQRREHEQAELEAQRQHQMMDDDDDMRNDDDEEQDNAMGGAMVEEARRMMQDDEEPQQKQEEEQENKGPKIKMRTRLGGKGKKKAAETKGETRAGLDTGPKTSADIELKSGASLGQPFTEKDIEFMKKAIQVLCQNTNPLGRSIEFVTDDLDSMTKEYEYWTKESHSCHSRLKEEQVITEQHIQPL